MQNSILNPNADTIVVTKPNLALIGIGFPTFVPTTGKPCFQIENVDGVRFGGVLLQAGSKKTSSLINWGYKGYGGNSSNPSFMYDMFARVGGPNNQHSYQVYATDMVVVNSGNVVIDGTWFWRADHGVGGEVYNGDNPVEVFYFILLFNSSPFSYFYLFIYLLFIYFLFIYFLYIDLFFPYRLA